MYRPRPRYPRRHGRIPALLLLAALAGFPAPLNAASAFVPIDHPAYGQVEGWVARGVLPPTPLSARPYTWERLAAMLDRAGTGTEADARRIAALRAEAGRHLDRPLRAELTVTGALVEGQPVRYKNLPADSGGPLVAYDGGVSYRETAGTDLRARIEGRAGPHLAAALQPRATFGDVGGGHPGWQEGYVALDLGPVALSLGRQPFAWGPARHGGFLLTPNAAPLPALRLGLREPHAFTERWAWLGTVDFSYLITRIETDRTVPRPYLTGLRLMWMPTPRLELGASRTIMLGGKGQPGLSAGDFVTILSGRNLTTQDTSNSIAGFDAAYTVPLSGARAIRLYGEYAGEDEAGHLPTKPAIRGGVLLPGLGPERRYTLRTEFAATDVFYDHARWGHNFWYGHSTYQSGYTYRGRLIGDAMGSDARTARLWLRRDGVLGHAELMLGWFATRFSDPEREDHWQGRARWERPSPAGRTMALDLRLERVTFSDAREDAWQSLLLATIARTAP